jgi:hypothetical protein
MGSSTVFQSGSVLLLLLAAADAIHPLILHAVGGVYLDLDSECSSCCYVGVIALMIMGGRCVLLLQMPPIPSFCMQLVACAFTQWTASAPHAAMVLLL